MKRLLIIDSHYLCHRGKFWVEMEAPDTQRTIIISNFLNDLLNVLALFKPNNVAFCWDSKQLLRRRILPEYKCRKPKTDEEARLDEVIRPQFDEIRDKVLPKMGWQNIFLEPGYEADDLIASIAIGYHEIYDEVICVARDHDLYQLLDYMVLWNPEDKIRQDKEWFTNQYGLEPEQWPLLKAIVGEGKEKDNIPGIKGAGDKTAIKYVQNNLNKTYAAYRNISSPEGQAIINRNLRLVTLPFDQIDFEIIDNEISLVKFISTFNKYKFSYFANLLLNKWESSIVNIEGKRS